MLYEQGFSAVYSLWPFPTTGTGLEINEGIPMPTGAEARAVRSLLDAEAEVRDQEVRLADGARDVVLRADVVVVRADEAVPEQPLVLEQVDQRPPPRRALRELHGAWLVPSLRPRLEFP